MMNNHIENSKKVIIIILAVLAIVLGVLIYKQKMPKVGETANLNSTNQGVRVSLSSFTNTDGTPAKGAEREYLFSIFNNLTVEEKVKYFEYASSISQESEVLDVTDCSNPVPLVLRVVDGGTIKLRNNSNTSLNLVISKDNTYMVGANSIKTITVNFGNGLGFYGYGCNNSPKPEGIINVVSK